MNEPGDRPRGMASLGRTAQVARAVVAPVVAGVLGAVVFLVMVQGAFRRGHTDLDFNHVLGTIIQGEASEVGSTNQALGVIGDSAGPTGLYATVIAGIVLVAIHSLIVTRLVRYHWLVQALALWLLTFLALGLVYAPVADSRLDSPIGTLGADAGGMTPVVLLISALGFAVIGARIQSLMVRPGFWHAHSGEFERQLQEVSGINDPITRTPRTEE